jgi:hypothetical protein
MRIKIDRMEVVVPSPEQQAQGLHTAKILSQELERKTEGPSAQGSSHREEKPGDSK